MTSEKVAAWLKARADRIREESQPYAGPRCERCGRRLPLDRTAATCDDCRQRKNLADMVHEAVEQAKADDDALAEAERRGAVKALRDADKTCRAMEAEGAALGMTPAWSLGIVACADGLRAAADAIEAGADW